MKQRLLILIINFMMAFHLVESASNLNNHTNTCSLKFTKQNADNLDIYWINLDGSVNRRNSMSQMMKYLGLENNYRISAVTPQSIHFPTYLKEGTACRALSSTNQSEEIVKAKELQPSARINRASAPRFVVSSFCGKVECEGPPLELATTFSHLYAIHKAAHKKGGKGSDYALILEDDISLAYEVDFSELIASAPKDFAILQLVTSNIEVFNQAWGNYTQDQSKKWVLRERNSEAWCAAAYIIHKQRVKKALAGLFRKETENTFSAKVEQPCDIHSPCCTPEDRKNPSEYCQFIFTTYKMADFFIFNLIPDGTYISALPLFGPLDEAMKSTLHQEKVARHILVWQNMLRATKEMIGSPKLIPSYVNVQCAIKNPIEKYGKKSKSSRNDWNWKNVLSYFGL